MKKFITTLKNIWGIDELRNRIIFTLTLVLIYRVGCYITLPGINPVNLTLNSGKEGLLGLFNMFAGGAFSRASIFALGVMPYISASIFMQLAGIIIPQVAKMQKEESGRRTINQYTRYLTVLVTAFQASAYIAYLRTQSAAAIAPEFGGLLFSMSTIIVLTAGTLFVMWLGEKITDKGIGNGTSLIIMVGILARLPESLLYEFSSKNTGAGVGGMLVFLIEIAMFIAVIVGLILLTQGTRRIPLNYARKIVGGAKDVNSSRDFIPLKVNSSGVMPIIFAQAIMFVPSFLGGVSFMKESSVGQWMQTSFSDMFGLWYNITFALLIIVFTYFYTAITVPTNKMADDLKRSGGFIPGIKPGGETAEFLDKIMSQITLPGSVFLALIAIFPAIVVKFLGVQQGWALFFGGTSLLIMVGVAIDTMQQINSFLLNRHYDGLMKTGKNRKAVV